MKKGKFIWLAAILFAIFSFSFLVNNHVANAGLLKSVEDGGLKNIGDLAYHSNVNTVLDPRVMVARAVNKLLGFLGIIMVVLIIYSGWQYMTAEGDKTKLETAKKRIQNAVIGLVIIMSAYTLTNFIIACSSYVTEPGILTNFMCQ